MEKTAEFLRATELEEKPYIAQDLVHWAFQSIATTRQRDVGVKLLIVSLNRHMEDALATAHGSQRSGTYADSPHFDSLVVSLPRAASLIASSRKALSFGNTCMGSASYRVNRDAI